MLAAGSASAQEECNLQYDGNGDGAVNVTDVLGVLSEFGEECEPVIEYGPCGPDSTVSYHGYDYSLVEIGEQCWFAENLRTEHYANGDSIPANLTDGEWNSTTSGALAVYGEDAGCQDNSPYGNACDPAWSLNEYGRLYNWYAVDDERGLCPMGWHVPTDGEYMTLEMELGMSESEANSGAWRGTDQGTQMKSSPLDYPSWDGTNASGFSALAGGFRDSDGYFYGGGDGGFFWSSSPLETYAWVRYLDSGVTEVYRGTNGFLRNGFSIRCIKD